MVPNNVTRLKFISNFAPYTYEQNLDGEIAFFRGATRQSLSALIPISPMLNNRVQTIEMLESKSLMFNVCRDIGIEFVQRYLSASCSLNRLNQKLLRRQNECIQSRLGLPR